VKDLSFKMKEISSEPGEEKMTDMAQQVMAEIIGRVIKLLKLIYSDPRTLTFYDMQYQ
jgi:hypothetical protein